MLREDGVEIGDEDDLRLDHFCLKEHLYFPELSIILVSNILVLSMRRYLES